MTRKDATKIEKIEGVMVKIGGYQSE